MGTRHVHWIEIHFVIERHLQTVLQQMEQVINQYQVAGRQAAGQTSRCQVERQKSCDSRNVTVTKYFPESIATLPPFGPIEEQKWFDQISSQ